MNASSALDAKPSSLIFRLIDTLMLNGPAPSCDGFGRSITGISRANAARRLADLMSGRVSNAATRNSPK